MSRTRKIEDLYFKTRCTECNKKIRLTFNTVKCPKCGTHFEDNEVKQFYYNCESKMVNNRTIRRVLEASVLSLLF